MSNFGRVERMYLHAQFSKPDLAISIDENYLLPFYFFKCINMMIETLKLGPANV